MVEETKKLQRGDKVYVLDAGAGGADGIAIVYDVFEKTPPRWPVNRVRVRFQTTGRISYVDEKDVYRATPQNTDLRTLRCG